ncbi:hypothetical protein EP7_005433 [Isosphaeraceae bacterium EP7]
MPCARLCAVYLYYSSNGVFYYGSLDCCTNTSATTLISTSTPFTTLGCDCTTNPMPKRCIARANPCSSGSTGPQAKASGTQHPVGDLAKDGAPILKQTNGLYPAFEEVPGTSEIIGKPRNFRLINPLDNRDFTLRLLLVLTTADPTHVALIATAFQAEPDPNALKDELVVISVLGERCIEVQRKLDGLIFTAYLADIWTVPAGFTYDPGPSK